MVSNVWANWEQKCGNEYDHESDQNGNENNDANADYEDDDDDDNYGDDDDDDHHHHHHHDDDDDDDAKHLCDKNIFIYGDGRDES